MQLQKLFQEQCAQRQGNLRRRQILFAIQVPLIKAEQISIRITTGAGRISNDFPKIGFKESLIPNNFQYNLLSGCRERYSFIGPVYIQLHLVQSFYYACHVEIETFIYVQYLWL